MEYCIFEGDRFETIRDQINKLAEIPLEGRPAKIYDDGFREDDIGKTFNELDVVPHLTENKGFIKDYQGELREIGEPGNARLRVVDELVQANCNYKLTHAQMIEQGYFFE